MTEFKKRFTFQQRKAEADRVLSKYPHRVPLILEPVGGDVTLDKVKFLVPRDLSIQEFLIVVKKRMLLKQEEAVFIFINNIIPPMSATLGEMYDKYREGCGFMYISVRKESAFGM